MTINKTNDTTPEKGKHSAADNPAATGTSAICCTHRVGTVTTGLCMVGFGILFLLNTLFDQVGYEMIFSLWPLILICLGLELFFSNFAEKRARRCGEEGRSGMRIVYDKAAVFLLILMTFFAMTMALADVGMDWVRSSMPR